MSLNVAVLPSHILEALHERGFSDERIARLDAEEAFHQYCNWHGLIGWGYNLRRTLDKLREAEREGVR